jgi:benzodiazapine receptor
VVELAAVHRQALLTRGLIAWFGSVFITALLGSLASLEAGSFYIELQRPSWAPPGWLFGPVWTALYCMIALAGWLHWRRHGLIGQRLVTGLFAVQLVLNALWSWLFFAWRRGDWAFVDILILLTSIAVIIALYFRAGNRVSAALLLPYLGWVSFASILNAWLWHANPAIL